MAIRIPACKWRRSRPPSGSGRRSPFIPVLLAAAPLPHQRQCQGWRPRGLSVCTLPHPSCSSDGCAGAPNEYRNRATVSRCGQIVLLVLRVAHIDGYSRFSFTRASAVVNCQSALECLLFRSASQAAVSSVSIALSGMRRSRHCVVSTLSRTARRGGALPRRERLRKVTRVCGY